MSEITNNEVNPSLFEPKKDYILYKYRFVIGLLFILIANNCILMMTIFSPLQTTLSDVYDQSITYTNLGTFLIFSIIYIPANFLANYILDTFGLRAGLLTGGVFTVGGLWLRCLSRHNFVWIFIGQLLGGIGQPFFYCTPPKIATSWFGVHERTLASTVLLISFNIGSILSSYVPQLFVDINADKTIILGQVAQMMFWFAILGTVSFALVLIFMRDKPPTAPSKVAGAIKYNARDSLKSLFKDRNTMLLLFCTALTFSTVNTYFGTMQQIAQPFNIDGDRIGDTLSVASFCSVIGPIALTPLFSKYRKFNLFLIILCGTSLVILVGNIFTAEFGNFYLYATSVIVYYTLMSPVLPISIDYAVDLSFPVAEFTVSGVWYAISSVLTTIGSLVVDQILSSDSTTTGGRWGLSVIIIYQALGTIPLFWVKEDLKRTKFEQEGLLNSKQVIDSSEA